MSEEKVLKDEKVKLTGEIDLEVSSAILDRLNKAVAAQPPRLTIDMTEVTYIDSSGLAALIYARQQVEKYGGKLQLLGVRESIRHIMEIARLDQVFKILPAAGEEKDLSRSAKG